MENTLLIATYVPGRTKAGVVSSVNSLNLKEDLFQSLLA
jgi:hypothetical protein